jgi:NADH-quinone oxidoreductase subunit L
MLDYVWLIPALPLAGFLVLLFGGQRLKEPWPGIIGTLTVAGSFLVTLGVYFDLQRLPAEERLVVDVLYTWLPVGGLHVDVATLADPLSMSMCMFVTGIAALIHVYSVGYMHGDPKFGRFFVYLNLFVFSMLVLVLGNSLLLTFVGWEGVGLCSYFLISFWFTEEANAVAGKKAFVTNRIGDFGFMLAIFLTFLTVGSLAYEEILPAAGSMATTTVTAIAALLFIGAVGKSAQIPLYVWLPDAMAGPTPVSALIHAATMVTAGVYLMIRINPMLAASADWLPTTIAVIGAATALLAATIAIGQNDIKKVLAYSTVSQLGYMFVAIGTGAYVAAGFHMITHAFFKGLMFLAAGSVIHGMHEEQDMRKMGGLRKHMPITFFTFLIGWLAIAGIPPFAGFWSKDDILLFAYQDNKILWVVGLLTALLTAFYMSRLMFLTFFGEPRWGAAAADVPVPVGGGDEAHAEGDEGQEAATPEAAVHGDHHVDADFTPHESPPTMTIPLIILAVFSVGAGVFNLPFGTNFSFLENWLEPVVAGAETPMDVAGAMQFVLAAISVVLCLIGIFVAYRTYLAHKIDAKVFDKEILARAWHIDEGYAAFVSGPGTWAFNALVFFDTRVIDGAVNGVAAVVRGGSMGLRRLQTGYLRNYALGVAVGAVLLLAWFITRAGI